MKKLLVSILMTLVVGVGAFAKQYVAFTDMESIEFFENNDTSAFADSVKYEFERWVNKYSEIERNRYTHITVVDKTGIVCYIWVYTENSKDFGIAVCDASIQPIGDYSYSSERISDPILVGLYFIEERFIDVMDLDTYRLVIVLPEVE